MTAVSSPECSTPDPEALRPSRLGFPVVGVGGSAGALEALLAFFGNIPAEAQMAFVVVLHLSPDHESNAAEILQRVTAMPVRQVNARIPLEAGHVYVIPPGVDLFTSDGHLQPTLRTSRRPPVAAIDAFFQTLAAVHADRAVAIVLSGTGRDGSVGLARVKEVGGITMAQLPSDARHDDMPGAAIATGMVDIVLPAAELGERLIALWNHTLQMRIALPRVESPVEAADPPSDGGAAELALLDIVATLRSSTRHDFRRYKRATMLRRIARRMQINGLADLPAYRDFLRARPDEVAPLLQDMLISVTSFFRDRDAFEALRQHVIPQVFDAAAADAEIRVWVAGCATGEESYSIAVLLREFADQFGGRPVSIQVFSTDINEAALAIGRRALYPEAIAADVSPERLGKYFVREGESYRVANSVREQVLFAKHNLLTDPPFSRVDLICCRNLLIYLDRSGQASALEMFRYALRPGGFLFLGGSESADAAGSLFMPFDKERRIYRVNAGLSLSSHARAFSQYAGDRAAVLLPPAGFGRPPREPSDPPAATLHQRALMRVASPSVLIDADHEVLHLSPEAGRYLGRGSGVPSHNLLNNVAPDIRLELRAALFKAQDGHETAHTRVVRSQADGTRLVIEISVYPVRLGQQEPARWLVMFREATEHAAAADTLAASASTDRLMIDRLEEESMELKAHLQQTLDRSAVSNEELKASNEELQAINEELRSATEELETSREELQSMNEELTTVNHELRMKVEESGRITDDLQNLMASSEIATVFVDRSLHIKSFTPQASKLLNLIPSDVDRPLLDIRTRLHYDEMADDAALAFRELRVIERRVASIDDRQFLARILPYRTAGDKIEGAVLTFFDVTELRLAEDRTRSAEERLRSAVALSHDFAVITTDLDGIVTTWNVGARHIFGYEGDEIVGRSINEIYSSEDRAKGVPEAERRLAAATGRSEDERWHRRKDGSLFFCSGVLTTLETSGATGYAKIARDVTNAQRDQREKDDLLAREQQSGQEARLAVELKDRFLAVMSHELKQPLNLIQVNAELLTRLPDTKDIPAAVRIGHAIQRAVGTQSQIVNDLLDLSRARTGKLHLNYQQVRLDELLQTLVVAIERDAVQKGIAVEVEAMEPLECQCDLVRVQQVFWNLIGNALKFTPASGRVTVALSHENGFARVAVSDTGAGIAPEYLPEVFGMFNQALGPGGSANPGMGIGLALVDELVRAHGGRVEAASEGLGTGARFTVWLPLKPTDTLPPDVQHAPFTDLGGWRVLAVDDDADSLLVFSTLLELEGAIVESAESGRVALDRLAVNRYDLMVSDIGMPEIDGFALIAAAREMPQHGALRAIAVTGYGRDADVRRAILAGFDAHISKPISIEQLKDALARLAAPKDARDAVDVRDN